MYLLRDENLPDNCPRPTAALHDAMLNYFLDFLRAWQRYPELRRGRKSMPHYNFLMVNFMLLIGPEVYDLHAPWFPQVTAAKLAKLQAVWGGFCVVLGWPLYVAEYDDQGKLHRRLLQAPAQPIGPVTRSRKRAFTAIAPGESNAAPKWKERRLEELWQQK